MLLPIVPLKNPITFGLSIWNITNIFFGQENYQVLTNTTDTTGTTGTTGILQVYYPKGSSSPSKLPVGGFGFFSTPNEIHNARDVTLEYSVMFDKSFNPVLGGKLPGLYISNGENTIRFINLNCGIIIDIVTY